MVFGGLGLLARPCCMAWGFFSPLFSLLFPADQGLGVAGVPVQQQPERHPGRRDGSGQNHPDHRFNHIPHGAQADQRPLPHHSTSLVSAPSPPQACPGVSPHTRAGFTLPFPLFFSRTLSNWAYEFDKWAPSVVKVSYKASRSFYFCSRLLCEGSSAASACLPPQQNKFAVIHRALGRFPGAENKTHSWFLFLSARRDPAAAGCAHGTALLLLEPRPTSITTSPTTSPFFCQDPVALPFSLGPRGSPFFFFFQDPMALPFFFQDPRGSPFFSRTPWLSLFFSFQDPLVSFFFQDPVALLPRTWTLP